ncbi:MAG: MerR family transcriptional regulator [Chloroflexales bacterium]|nr:MerR family transcriptional regulator [Chloroflexales bacterium]
METHELTIQQVATLTGLSVHTLRYYERIGLLHPVGRAANSHRRYATADVEWLQFLTRLRATGMSIRLMQQYADLRRQGDATLHERRQLLEIHQREVQARIDELQRSMSVIIKKINHYKELETADRGDG